MADQRGAVADIFDRAAHTYDAVGVEWFRPVARGLVEQLAPRPGEQALDIGCGRGAALFPLAAAVGPTGGVLGIDLAPRMVELTRADARDLPQVQVQVADAVAPGLPQSSFDLVAASLVVFFMPDPPAALAAWRELLVPGGRLGLATFGAQDPRWRELDALFSPFLPPELLDARTSGGRGPFASDEGVEALLREAGFVDVRTARLSITATFSDPHQWLAFSWSHGQRAMWEAVPAERVDDVQAAAFHLLEELRPDGGGPIALGQEVRYTLGYRPGAVADALSGA